MRLILSVSLLGLLIACSTNGTGITREEAIQRASQSAAYGGPELSPSKVAPGNFTAERMTFTEAVTRISQTSSLNAQDSERSVWLVTMDGEWYAGMAAPGTPLTQHALHHFSVIIDATTGDVLESVGKP
jgi:hypothetical protein